MMMVKNGDRIIRNGKNYEVVCADKKVFVIAPCVCGTVRYEIMEAYSNDHNIMSLSELDMEVM